MDHNGIQRGHNEYKYKIRSSATAEKQRVSCTCLLSTYRLANWSCNARGRMSHI